MDWGLAERLGVSRGVLILLVLVALAQVALQILALVSLYRAREVMFGNKWIWAVVVLLFGFVGAILYFALGRLGGGVAVAPEVPPGAPGGGERAKRAVDALYGPKEKD